MKKLEMERRGMKVCRSCNKDKEDVKVREVDGHNYKLCDSCLKIANKNT